MAATLAEVSGSVVGKRTGSAADYLAPYLAWIAADAPRHALVCHLVSLQAATGAQGGQAAVMIRNLGGRAPRRDTFSKKGREWLAGLELPAMRTRRSRAASARPTPQPSPRHLVGYVGLDPRSRQSGVSPVHHGHISKQGSSSARHVLCEAAHAAMRSPGPLRAFGQPVRSRRGSKIATVAVAYKLLCLAWQLLTKEQDYLYERPAGDVYDRWCCGFDSDQARAIDRAPALSLGARPLAR